MALEVGGAIAFLMFMVNPFLAVCSAFSAFFFYSSCQWLVSTFTQKSVGFDAAETRS